MTPEDYARHDALALAARMKRGEVTQLEVTEAAIAAVERVEGRLRAFCHTAFDAAREAAAAGLPAGPFQGVPFALKDTTVGWAGLPATHGSGLSPDAPAGADSVLGARYRAAGLNVLGRTNMPEFGSLGVTEPLRYGPTHSPWDAGFSCGGSSGGAAAIVAARALPMAHGGDGAGSIRIPASCCGVFGLKVTRARFTGAPEVGEASGGISAQHALTVTVRDSAWLLDATHGPAPGDPYPAPPPDAPFHRAIERDPPPLRIAVSEASPTGTTFHPDCVAAVRDAADLLARLGHRVERVDVPVGGTAFRDRFRRFWGIGVAVRVKTMAAALGLTEEEARARIEPYNRYVCQQMDGVSAADHQVTLSWFHALGRRLAAFHEDWDVWLAPTLGTPPPPLGFFDGRTVDPAEVMERFIEFLPVTPIANLTGQPSASVPLWWNAAGLPVGVHLQARFGDEATVLALSAQLERARPWRDRLPPVSVLAG